MKQCLSDKVHFHMEAVPCHQAQSHPVKWSLKVILYHLRFRHVPFSGALKQFPLLVGGLVSLLGYLYG